MRWAMAYPCSAPGCSTRRINMPKVPGNISFLAIELQGLDFLCLDKTCQPGKGEQGKEPGKEMNPFVPGMVVFRTLRPNASSRFVPAWRLVRNATGPKPNLCALCVLC